MAASRQDLRVKPQSFHCIEQKDNKNWINHRNMCTEVRNSDDLFNYSSEIINTN